MSPAEAFLFGTALGFGLATTAAVLVALCVWRACGCTRSHYPRRGR